ncbi:hypothetical protein V8G54_000849 [Vigna mungo]|uniref:Uncharacterized protein n=1 Tax=Vigna mungo TaxID=3915 RepID=A0AAQ3P611_VIGMU
MLLALAQFISLLVNQASLAIAVEQLNLEGGFRRRYKNNIYALDEKERNVRDLPYEEYEKRRKEGSPAHHCSDRSLRVTILAVDESELMSHEIKLPNSNLEDKVVLQRGVMLGYKVGGYSVDFVMSPTRSRNTWKIETLNLFEANSLPKAASQYRKYEDAFFNKVKDGLMIAKENPALTAGVAISTALLVMRALHRLPPFGLLPPASYRLVPLPPTVRLPCLLLFGPTRFSLPSIQSPYILSIMVVESESLNFESLRLGSQFMNLSIGPTCRIELSIDRDGGESSVEVALAETKAETVYLRHETGTLRQNCEMMRQDIQAILKDRKIDNRGVRDGMVVNRSGDDGGQTGAGCTGAMINWRKRVELPVFECGEPWNWMSRAEKFFEVQKVEEEEKMPLGFISMEGYAGSWFRFWWEKTKNYSWEGLKRALGIRFGGGTHGGLCQGFSGVSGSDDSDSRGANSGLLMAGLREEVSNHVRPHDRPDLMTAMRVARDVEKQCNHSKIGSGQTARNLDSWGGTTKVVSGSEHSCEIQGRGGIIESTSTARTTEDGKERNTRNLPYSEFVKRREEGRCFRCGGPFSPGHRCLEKGSRMLILVEAEEEGSVAEPEPKPPDLN